MRVFILLITVVSACSCFSILNLLSFGTTGQKSNHFHLAKRDLLNVTLTDEEILRCQNLTDENIKNVTQGPTQKELQDILSQCLLLLRQNSEPFSSKNEDNSTRSPPSEIPRNPEHDFSTKEPSTKGSVEDVKSKNKDSSDSSNEILSTENIEKGLTTQSSIYFKTSTDLEYSKTEIVAIWNIIMPGTKWCGAGTTAVNDDDLGYFEDVDRCCRAHDKCYDMMSPGEHKYNLTNTSPFTVLNCKCDDALYDCLSEINSVASNTVGNTFFNILGRSCYMLDYPRICTKYYPLIGCQEYGIDKTAKKVYQWKTAKKYLKTPFTITG